ncbi:unnamed protein product [Nippostrongylus brasiliensis]|uniref:Uncharacterized protein n=1 Tax=Nippostrongylus brasiliensis TaxID=27835 RepID=A0A0N4XHD8_NIPBR|nr:hypothetical protein Q1695_006913 [Nippostrongylus brasiliensis]VDL65530.1 unnamed protein product [Nippostrongylus brasiliensis]
MPNPPAKEDTWAFQKIGTAFPPNPVKCLGQQNMYVALWYKHGKPIHGRSWNNGGVVECSFPYKNAELRTAQQLEGNIQVLQYTGDHNTQGFWYEWIKYKERFEKTEARQLLRCGDSFPILWKDRPQGALLGYVDNKTEIALFSCDGKVYEQKGPQLNEMYIIMRNTVGGPPFCECAHCPKAPPPPPVPAPGPPPPRVMIDEWMDIRAGDPWPDRILVKALDKTLDNTIPGENPDQYVALWYQAGEPVMGRIWNENGKVAANFCWNKNEYKGNVGSIQVLVHLSEHVRGFDYKWIPYPQAATFDKDREWIPVHVNNVKGDISSGVITFDGKQILGKVDVKNEKASAGFGGKENMLVGPACAQNTIVLCRKARPGYKFD